MLTHTPVAAIEARELLRPLIVGITGGNLFERSLAQESICTRCQFSQTTSGLVAVHSGCCLSSSSSFSCCGGDARRKGGTFPASVPLFAAAAMKRRLVPLSRTACGARSRCFVRGTKRQIFHAAWNLLSVHTGRGETRIANDAAAPQRWVM